MTQKKDYNADGRTAEDRALEKFADMMIEKISSLQDDWEKPWFTDGTMRWPKNLSGREYNGQNALMLMLLCEKEGYKLPVFCTFNRVAGLNYNKDKQPLLDANGEKLPQVSVNRGEKSFPVFLTSFTVVNKETKEKISFDDYNQLSEYDKSKYSVYPKLNVYNVFNVAQTNLEQARPQLFAKLVADNSLVRPTAIDREQMSFAPLDAMIDRNLWVCPIRPKYQDKAYYSISRHEIVVPEKKQFIDGERYYGTVLHEMTHSTGAAYLLDRIKPASFASADYAREELVAELGSALVASRYGMGKNLKEASAAYLKSWLTSLKESPQFLKTTLQDVKRASSMIVQKVDKIAQDLEQDAGEKQEVATQEKVYYSSVAYLQFTDDTARLDAFKDKGDYGGLLTLAKEYYDGNGIDEKHTYLSPMQNRGDDLLIEDKDFAVVYNGSVGGTYEVMLKFTEQEVRDHIRRYGVGLAGDTLKGVAREMAAEQFVKLEQRKTPVFEMPNGDVLHVGYNKESDMIDVGPATNAGLAVQHSFPYNHDAALDDNLQAVNEKLNGMEEYRTELQEAEYSGGMHR